ncbi:MAG: hypothetical protein R3B91_20335 [Planctomycetaceae bacterium]
MLLPRTCMVALTILCCVTLFGAEDGATPVDRMNLLSGFHAELLYSVPSDEQGSWVAMTIDPEGRFIVSDQHGKLYRVTVPPIGESGETQVEPIDLQIGMAHGLLWAFDSLYIMVNAGKNDDDPADDRFRTGLYRATDTDGDGNLDEVTLLKPMWGRRTWSARDHSSPDGKSPSSPGEPHGYCRLLWSRVPDTGMKTSCSIECGTREVSTWKVCPGGWIAQVSPDGQQWNSFSNGFRNEFDIAYNSTANSLLTMPIWSGTGTPWYRPTRAQPADEREEPGWRSGTGKWPEYYPDSLGLSSTSVPARRPASSRDRSEVSCEIPEGPVHCRLSYGTIYAVAYPDGSSYRGTAG